ADQGGARGGHSRRRDRDELPRRRAPALGGTAARDGRDLPADPTRGAGRDRRRDRGRARGPDSARHRASSRAGPRGAPRRGGAREARRRQPRPGPPRAAMIPGLRVGHVTDPVGLTGCTVLLSDAPAVGGVEIRGWASGVHGLDFLDPRHLVPTLDGVVLAGGSAYGLEAIWGVMEYLEEQGVGFPVSHTVVPHVAGGLPLSLRPGAPP